MAKRRRAQVDVADLVVRMNPQQEYMLGDLIFRKNPYTSSTAPMVPTWSGQTWQFEPWPLTPTNEVFWWPFRGRSLSVAAALLLKYKYQRHDGTIASEELLIGYERELQDTVYPERTPRMVRVRQRAAAPTHQHRQALGDLICDENPFTHALEPPQPMRVKPGWMADVELEPTIQRWRSPFPPVWRRIRQAIRVPYFWEIPDPNHPDDEDKKVEIWEHVLIGYVGAGGGF